MTECWPSPKSKALPKNHFYVTFILLSASALNLTLAKILSYGKKLNTLCRKKANFPLNSLPHNPDI